MNCWSGRGQALLLLFALCHFQICGRSFGVEPSLTASSRLMVIAKAVPRFVGSTKGVAIENLAENVNFIFVNVEHLKIGDVSKSRFHGLRDHLIFGLTFLYLHVWRNQIKTLSFLYRTGEMKFSGDSSGGVSNVLQEPDYSKILCATSNINVSDDWLIGERKNNPSPLFNPIFAYLNSNYDDHSHSENSDDEGRKGVELVNPIVRLFSCILCFCFSVFFVRRGVTVGLNYDGLVCWAGMFFFLLLSAGMVAGFFWLLPV